MGQGRQQTDVRPGATRGNGRLRGRRLRKVQQPARVCAATSGPGAIHLLNGLYDAKLDRVPVVAIVGQTNRSAMGAPTSRKLTC
ncbi:thiamine pyrophosphate enzyme, N-terminal TPP binding domain protein [Mycobacterium kansasii]|uniref:Thiamine pyrophosphate enzyme, N-terminal TPP binding domain protein n=1 Tax=Mycobacterium kansasii TaxID=1768 RepID=A0A1V3WBM8_MYCKA|nr:thiamine pyrophosphate enzyme, N-terminal TPP binding domain protein [Mycobacterium kansasii]